MRLNLWPFLGIGIAVTLMYSTILIERFHWQPKSVGLFNVSVIFLAMTRPTLTRCRLQSSRRLS